MAMFEELRSRLLHCFYHDSRRLSRNRNFHAYQDPSIRHIAQSGRLLRAIERLLLEGELLTLRLTRLDHAPDGKPFLLELVWKEGRRLTYLHDGELAILRQNARIDALFHRAMPDGSGTEGGTAD